MIEKLDIILGGLACVLIISLAVALGIDNHNSPKQVYKIEYIDINNQKQIIYTDTYRTDDGYITYKEVNHSEYKTISGRIEIEPYKRLTYKEMEKHEFPQNK
ncbi:MULTISPECIES: hypothetical protein [unclassified Bacillus cereus group]|uniref:hypothetical protein n=1 Tax=unclassified Bacillus cereus group TaxID=2750818 RepID=UPI001F56B445|nr:MULTISPECIES: hypothetical protein [unclassified Bacillus cereus group]